MPSEDSTSPEPKADEPDASNGSSPDDNDSASETSDASSDTEQTDSEASGSTSASEAGDEDAPSDDAHSSELADKTSSASNETEGEGSNDGEQESELAEKASSSSNEAGAEAEEPADDPSAEDVEEHSVEPHLRALETILRYTRKQRRQTLFAEGFLWYAAAMGAVASSGLIVGMVAPGAVPEVVRWLFAVGGGAATLGAAVALVRFLRQKPTCSDVARALERAHPAFRNNVVAALEFGRRLTDRPDASDRELGFSRLLAAKHLGNTVETLREHTEGGPDLTHLLPDRLLAPPLLAAAGIASFLLLSVGLAPDTAMDVLRAPVATADSETDGATRVESIIGDLRIKYTAPSYTGRGVRTELHSSGHVKALEGSQVSITGRPLDGVRDVEMVVDTGEGARTVPMDRTRGGRVRAEMVVTRDGSYRFQAERPEGAEVTDDVERTIDVVPDKRPDLTITSHSGEIEVSPGDVLDIEFTVHDDYGIEKVERVHYFAGSKSDKQTDPVNLPALTETPENVDGTLELDLGRLSLQPKDVVVFYLRATDNNSTTGSSTGKSEKLTLRVSSPEDEHLENIQAQKKIAEKLLMLLADYLEHPMGTRETEPNDEGVYRQVVGDDTSPSTLADRLRQLEPIHRKEERLLKRMKELAGTLESDPLMAKRDVTLFKGLHEQLRELHETGGKLYDDFGGESEALTSVEPGRAQQVADHLAEVEGTLETGVLRLQELIASQKMEAIKTTQKDIKKLQKRLKNLLERYKKTKDPELKKAIKREIQRLKQRMAELMSRMRMQIRKLPQRHVNREALKKRKLQSQSNKLSSGLEQLEKKLEKDDIDGALKALEQMSSSLDSLGQKMNEQFSNARPQGLSKMDKKMSKLIDEANNLRSMEQSLEKKTRELRRKQQKRRQKKIDEMLDEFVPKMLRKVGKQQSALDDMARRNLPVQHQEGLRDNRKSLRTLRDSLEQRDIKRALEAARESIDDLQTLQFNLELSKRHASSDSPRGRAVDRSVEDAEKMVPRGEEIEKALERMMDRAKSKLDKSEQRQMRKLSKRQKKIEKRARKLEKQIKKASKEFPMVKQQLQPKLGEAKKEMKRARKRLSEGKPQGALDSERGALKQLDQLKRAMKRTVQKNKKRQQRRSGNGRSMRDDEVEIPGDQDEASRKALRRDLMEAMKEDKLKEYEGEIQEYYKSLVE